ncbi:GNAT family N-acetyltransferase [Chelatococcus sp. GCM10030263]|uniref:GNAT family N-acetyltransferase n=1 Tax=Chelatococcus sp. GCM10030263 TaxID=3273387 RepID=UPI00361EA03F
MTLSIRPATPRDAALIVSFIRELAEYEKLLDETRASEADIATALFGENPRVFCDIAEWDGVPAGHALWFYNFSTFLGRHGIWLEDLYVRPPFRAKGIGKALIAHLAARCVRERLGRLEWWVLDWNEPAIGFYKRHGAVLMDDWTLCRLSGEPLKRLAEEGP